MINVTSFIRAFSISFDPLPDTDLAGYVIHACPASEFVNNTIIPSADNLINKGKESSFFYTLPEDKPAGVWGIKVAAYDTFGTDELNYSEQHLITVASLDPLDQVPPNVPVWGECTTGVEASGAVDNIYAKVEWTLTPVPEDFSNYILAYKATSDTDFTELLTTETTHKFTGLVAGKEYQFKVRAVDQWNNASDFSTLKTIVAAADSVAPNTPTVVTATGGMKKIIISFAANTEPDLAGYEVHVSATNNFTPSSSTLVAKGLDTLYSYEGLVDTTYYVKLRAYDHSGNYSGYSAQASAKTMFVVTQDLVDDIITTAKLANDSVTSEILAANAVTSTEIADNAITSPKILAGAIIAGKIATDAVTANTIAANAVTAGKIAVGAVTAGTIAANAVTATTIQAGAVTSDKVTTGELLTLSAQIKDAIITDAKITSLNASKITTGTLSASTSISVGDAKIKLDGASSSITVANNAGTVTDMVTVGKLTTGSYGLSVKDKSGLQVFRVDENGAVLQNLTAGTIDANKVTINNLVVGSNVTMGPNAYISWSNVTSQPTIPTNTNQLTDGAGLGTTASWANVTSKPTDIMYAGTYIDANNVFTGNVYANKIKAGTIDVAVALNAATINSGTITGGTITGSTITGGTIQTATSGYRSVLSGATNNLEFYDTSSIKLMSIGLGNITTWGAYPLLVQKKYGSEGLNGWTYAGIQSTFDYDDSKDALPGVSSPIPNWLTVSSASTKWAPTCLWVQAENTNGGGATGLYATANDWSTTYNNRAYIAVDASSYRSTNLNQAMCGVRGSSGSHGSSYSGCVGVVGAGDTYDFYAGGVGGNYGPFTGSHDVILGDSVFEIGDIVNVLRTIAKSNVSTVLFEVIPTNSVKQSGVFGVFIDRVEYDYSSFPSALIYNTVEDREGKLTAIPMANVSDYFSCGGIVNALGEGQVNVCKDGGDIHIGDYICSSNRLGKGMKQDDDLLHSYTVAKSLEDCIWTDEEDDIRMIACTYHCG